MNRRVSWVFITILFLTGLFIANYINDIVGPKSVVTKDYWFVTVVEKQRVLNSVGAYYLFMNAVLLFLTILALWCYLSLSAEIFRIAKALRRSSIRREAIENNAKLNHNKLVAAFNESYVCIKLLIAIYAINIFVWSRSPLGDVTNALAALIALSLVLFILVPAPRLYLEYQWHALGHFAKETYQDTRTTREKWMSIGLDWVIVSLLLFVSAKKYSIDPVEIILAPPKALWEFILNIFSS